MTPIPCYADDKNLYLILPSPTGSYTLKFPIASGLSKALPFLRGKPEPKPTVATPMATAKLDIAKQVLRGRGMIG